MGKGRPDEGIVFNLQKYSVHDGPGIRTIVFLKGCPLRCIWCCNPESQKPEPELACNAAKCISTDACGRCIKECPTGAARKGADGRIRIDRKRCNGCLECAGSCPSGALIVYGERSSVSEVIDRVEEDGAFYSRSGGGLTLGGGDPLYQPEFAFQLLEEARRRRIHTAMETSGLVRWDALEQACRRLDVLLYDIKCIDRERHKAFTGGSNRTILANLRRIRREFPNLPINVRTPVVPGFNDSEAEIGAVLAFVDKISDGSPGVTYEALPYHRMGKPKYGYLGRSFPMKEAALKTAKLKSIRKLINDQFTLHCRTNQGG